MKKNRNILGEWFSVIEENLECNLNEEDRQYSYSFENYEDSLLEPSEVKKLIEENERNRRTIISLAEGKINCIEALQAECRRAADDLF